MTSKPLETLSDMVTEAHTKIQKDFLHINPVVGINQGLRKSGYPADAVTIDCLKSGKRIIIILHDEQPEIIQYQFSFKEKDPSEHFESLSYNDLTSQTLYDWMKGYFSNLKN